MTSPSSGPVIIHNQQAKINISYQSNKKWHIGLQFLFVFLFSFCQLKAMAYVSPEGCLMVWSEGWIDPEAARLENPAPMMQHACELEKQRICRSGKYAQCEKIDCQLETVSEIQVSQRVFPQRACTGKSVIARLNLTVRAHNKGASEKLLSSAVQLKSEPYCEQCAHYCPEAYVYDEGKGKCVLAVTDHLPQAKWEGTNAMDCRENIVNDSGHVRYRHHVLSGSIPFSFFYSNYAHMEKTATGYLSERTEAASQAEQVTRSPLTFVEYQAKTDGIFGVEQIQQPLSTRALGNVTQYWRHEYDPILRKTEAGWILDLSDGLSPRFDKHGFSYAHPHFILQENFQGEEHINTVVSNNVNDKIYVFDLSGKLQRLRMNASEWVELDYDRKDRLAKLTHGNGDWVAFAYRSRPTRRVTSLSQVSQSYIRRITMSDGRKFSLSWHHKFTGRYATYHLLTDIREKKNALTIGSMKFEYADKAWPESLTAIYANNPLNRTSHLQRAFDYTHSGALAHVHTLSADTSAGARLVSNCANSNPFATVHPQQKLSF